MKKGWKKDKADVELPVGEAAERLGITVRQLNAKIAEGCPSGYVRSGKSGPPKKVIPMKAAAEWLMARGVRLGQRTVPKLDPVEAAKPAEAISEPPAPDQAAQPAARQVKPSDLGYIPSIERSKQAEIVCWSLFVNAQKSGNAAMSLAAFRSWESAKKSLCDDEMNVLTLEHFKRLAKEEARGDIQTWGEPVRIFLDGMPRTLASRVNPTNPAQAEKILRDWLNTQLYPLMHNPFKSHEKAESKPEDQDPANRMQEAGGLEAAPEKPEASS